MISKLLRPEDEHMVESAQNKYLGMLLGTLTGDCLGLPYESLSPRMKKKIYGQDIEHNFIHIPFFCRLNICSDDTEHAWITAVALYDAKGNGVDCFARSLAQKLRVWLLTFPIGIGKATLISCFKLLIGKDYSNSGVYSAGNGAAIRALVIGAFYSKNTALMLQAVQASTIMTHTDQKAYEASIVMALAAATAINTTTGRVPISSFFNAAFSLIKGEELSRFLLLAQNNLHAHSTLDEYLNEISISETGVSGYINHTVPAVIYCWLRYYGDYNTTVSHIIAAGGDTDTTAALAGGLSGLTVGVNGIPKEWLNDACSWPLRHVHWIKLCQALSGNACAEVPKPCNLLFLCRNIMCIPIFGIHIVRRIINYILPPWK